MARLTRQDGLKETAAAASFLKQPYARMLFPEDDGTFRGEVLEFPGCIAIGNTANEALSALERAAMGWVKAALANGQTIPLPIDGNEFSGRLVLRLPKTLHKKATHLAERDGVSLNQFIITAIAEQVGEKRASWRFLPVRSAYHQEVIRLQGDLITATPGAYIPKSMVFQASASNTLSIFNPLHVLQLTAED